MAQERGDELAEPGEDEYEPPEAPPEAPTLGLNATSDAMRALDVAAGGVFSVILVSSRGLELIRYHGLIATPHYHP